jgi:perosamine synthetase
MSFLLSRVADPAGQAARAANYAFLFGRLQRFILEQFTHLPEGTSTSAFPISFDRKEELLEELARRSIAALNIWQVPHPFLPAADFPRVAALRKSVIALPVHQGLGILELEWIVEAVLGCSDSRHGPTRYTSIRDRRDFTRLTLVYAPGWPCFAGHDSRL